MHLMIIELGAVLAVRIVVENIPNAHPPLATASSAGFVGQEWLQEPLLQVRVSQDARMPVTSKVHTIGSWRSPTRGLGCS